MSDDRQTIERCLDGHPHDFRLLVDRHGPALRCRLLRDVGDRELVDESVQETLVRAFFLLPRLREPESFWGWLLGIGQRVLKEQQRARRRARRPPRLSNGSVRAAGPANGTAPPADAASADPRADPGALEAAVVALPEPYREVILLRFYAGLSCSVIAEQLNVPVGTVTKRLSRAYDLLRDGLAQPPALAGHAATVNRSPMPTRPTGGAS